MKLIMLDLGKRSYPELKTFAMDTEEWRDIVEPNVNLRIGKKKKTSDTNESLDILATVLCQVKKKLSN